MPDTYNGRPGNLGSVTPHDISSSTNANPIEITTSDAHGLINGDSVWIYDHETNISANGIYRVTVVNTTKFTINNAGVGVGGATGAVQPLTYSPSSFEIPSDGDDPDAASVNVAFETLADRTALLQEKVRCFFTPSLSSPRMILGLVESDIDPTSLGGSSTPNSAWEELSNTRFVIDRMYSGQVVLVHYTLTLVSASTLPRVALFAKAAGPGVSVPTDTMTLVDGTSQSITSTKQGYNISGMVPAYADSGGNLTVGLSAYTNGAGTVEWYGSLHATAIVFG